MKTIFVLLSLLICCSCLPIEIPPEEINYGILGTKDSNYPITTMNEAFELAIDKFGSEDIWNCDQDNMIKEIYIEGDLPLDEFGLYGYRATTLINDERKIVNYVVYFECKIINEWYPDGKPKRGMMGLNFKFDPNNGWIQYLICNNEIYDDCPKDDEGDYIRIMADHTNNPNYEMYYGLI